MNILNVVSDPPTISLRCLNIEENFIKYLFNITRDFSLIHSRQNEQFIFL